MEGKEAKSGQLTMEPKKLVSHIGNSDWPL